MTRTGPNFFNDDPGWGDFFNHRSDRSQIQALTRQRHRHRRYGAVSQNRYTAL
ncbi:MAG: hypothetical protein ACKO4L_01450 [Nodosilinea sp.]